MQAIADNRPATSASHTTIHPIGSADAAAMTALLALAEPNKGMLQGIAARPAFDAIMGRVAEPEDVNFEPDTVGGIPGWWCRPADAAPGVAILHLHGGWFNWGTALAFRHLVGHIARRAGAD